MNSEELERRLWLEIDTYEYDPARFVGDAFSPENVQQYIEQLRQCIVTPYVMRFELRETADQIGREKPQYAEYWVVAHGDDEYLEWYDPRFDEYGLAVRGDSEIPISIGVRGDLVSVFIAM
jgi:hypothetical protein